MEEMLRDRRDCRTVSKRPKRHLDLRLRRRSVLLMRFEFFDGSHVASLSKIMKQGKRHLKLLPQLNRMRDFEVGKQITPQLFQRAEPHY